MKRCCDGLIEAIDKYIQKADENLEEALDEAGFADAEGTVKEISALEENVAQALKRRVSNIIDEAEKSSDLQSFGGIWSNIKAADSLGDELSQILLDEFVICMPKLISNYLIKTDPELVVGRITDRTAAWAVNWSKEIGSIMNVNFHKEIEAILMPCLKDGRSVSEFIQYLIESNVRGEYYKARRVAVTEMLRAHSYAREEALIQSPAVEYKEWVHTGSRKNKPRQNHVDMSGKIVDKSKSFELTGADGSVYYPMFPRDTVLPASESVNCHCIHRGIVSEEILGLSLEERCRLQQEAIDADDEKWKKELEAKNKAKAGIDDTRITLEWLEQKDKDAQMK